MLFEIAVYQTWQLNYHFQNTIVDLSVVLILLYFSALNSRHTRSRSSQPTYYSPMHRHADIDELSSLPSAGSSLVDIESNADTVETDVLLSSFKGDKPQGSETVCVLEIIN